MAPTALSKRDANARLDTANTNQKRKRIIDLTLDSSEDEAPAKIQKGAAAVNSRRVGNQPAAQQSDAATSNRTPSFINGQIPSSSTPSGHQSVYEPYSSSAISNAHNQAEREAWLVPDDEDTVDVDEIVSSTQNAADHDELHRYGDLPTKIVGVQYYRGLASPGEYVLLLREPGNPYDKNAIRVDNIAHQQIGHIPKRIAEKLAKYLDRGWLCIDGRLAGSIGTYDCPLEVNLLGPDPNSPAGLDLRTKMAADKLPTRALQEAEKREKEWQKEHERQRKEKEKEEKKRLVEARRAAAAGGRGGAQVSLNPNSQYTNQTMAGPSGQPVMEDLMEVSQRFNPRAAGGATDQYGMQEEALANMPTTQQPAAIKTDMLPYQLQALRWMLDQEDPTLPQQGSKDSVQLWKPHDRQANAFVNIATNHPTATAPTLISGGILADDMGLGKTLEVISLLIADAEKNGRGTTLVVAPLSVMSNWSGQIAHHIRADQALKVYTYHGSGRVKIKAADFQQYDVVITTYQTLAGDYMPRGSGGSKQPEQQLRSTGLYSMEWRRIILDEGHIVRNPASKGAAAVTALTSRSRWVLTGTPIVNSLKDLYSALRFLGVTGGLEQLPVWNSVLTRPLKSGDPSAVYLLQAIMKALTLRRRKDMAFIDLRLPQLEEFMHPVRFTPKERERYSALETEAQGLLKDVQKKKPGNVSSAYNHLLEILLRMRQCCNHWQLCGERVTSLLAQLHDQKTVNLTPENQKALQDILQVQIESQEDCAVCLEILHDPVITTCGHFFGRECISKAIETQHKCPMCRADLKDDSVLVSPAHEGDEEADDEMDLTQSSSKLEALVEILGATKAKHDKTIIFSQWTRFLDIVQSRFNRDGYKYCRIDGTMSAQKRDAALQALEKDDDCTVMLASLGVCAVGLNLTAANQVILSDTWWAPAIEDQAVDRVHRLGQRKETRVWRLVVEGTIEKKTLAVQAQKRELMQLAFSEKAGKREKTKTSRLADIQMLLGPATQPQARAVAGAS
ncbi:hypothetical protein LTR78_001901 [Recurvomyces mirabilis]|uniref:Uncharacterized protein n=1 Tax=Recurvomyces mirabilis TaxID=574656 RepID=A0AAE1C593_9PEZI|nr:hypothetical protein LTR78_001901 [Recurvomyces mirabilis]KAK5156661.1 hypothetical protein LTS14_004873 [Recurvomyces mirabilis]